MSITTSVTDTHLTRSTIWTGDLKEALQDSLDGQSYVRWLSDFPDGDNWTIPSIGEATVRDYSENTAATYDSLDTGQFQFNVTEYKQSGLYITEQARQDSWYSSQLEASFVPKMQRALAESVETDIFSLANPNTGVSKGAHTQTNDDPNTINGAAHRLIGSGSAGATERYFDFSDAARALYALKRANVPDSNLIGIVDPSVEYYINLHILQTDVASSAAQPRWDGLVEDGGIASGMRFVRNIFGFDLYVSNYLSANTEQETNVATDNIEIGDINNIFFSAAGQDILPMIGAWRQMPKVDSDYNKDFQREEYIVTSRYGLDLYRPENFVTIATNPTV